MNEIIFFALALLSVPVFARYADVTKEAMRMYHTISIGGLFLILGEVTRLAAAKIMFMAPVFPVIDYLATILAFALVMVGTMWLSVYYLRHPKEI